MSQNSKYYDSDFFETLQKIVRKTDFLSSINPVNKNQFIESIKAEKIIPLKYNIDLLKIKQILTELDAFSIEISNSSLPDIIKECYKNKVREEQNKANLLVGVSKLDDDQVFSLSQKIYGVPDKKLVVSLIYKLKTNLDLNNVSYSNLVEISNLFSWVKDEDFEKVDEVIFEATEKEDLIETPETIKVAFEEALLNIDITDWMVKISDRNLVVSVDILNKSINIPKNKLISKKSLKILIAHEIQTHVLRFKNGFDSKLMLLAHGLDGYEMAEEGVAKYGEKLAGAHPFANQISFILGISARIGIFGEYYTTQRLYNLLREYFSLSNDSEKADLSLIRILRGITGVVDGTCLTKDHIYTSGYFALAKDLENDEFYKFSLKGKFDPLNDKHIKLVNFLENNIT